jgi:aldehyde dehydrogenase (NAD+)/betaine-aldehyde dehydrogenase
VWAGTTDHALTLARQLRAGQVDVNGAPYNPAAPFGGFGDSGLGREGGKYGIEEFVEIRAIQMPVSSARETA